MLHIPLWQRIAVVAVTLIGLLLALPNAFSSRVERANDARASIEGGVSDATLEAEAGLWPSWLPSGLVNLGLDLRGGAHLLAEVQVAEVYASRMDLYWPVLRDALVAQRDSLGFVTREEGGPADELRVRISNPDQIEAALGVVRGLAQPVASLAGVGATDIEARAENGVIVVTLSEAERAATDDRTLRTALEIVRNRIDEAGTREPTIMRQGADRILVQVPGVGSAQEVKDLIGTTAQLTFHPVVSSTSDPEADPGPGNILLPSRDTPGEFLVLERTPVVSGEELVDAQPSFDENGRPAVSFRFNGQGAIAFGDYTAENIGTRFAIVLDNEVISAPVIQSHIPGGSGIITGQFAVEETTDLAVLLRSGALPAELVFLEERTVGPELGRDSIEAGRTASLLALAAVFGFMVLAYGFFGVFAALALLVNLVLLLGAMSLIGATLTLPGIAGIVLTMGMAVDSNVLIYERMRDEIRAGKRPAQVIEAGFDRALSAIVDANVTTLIVAIVMFLLGAGPIRGFAVTLGIGILTTLFSAVFVTRFIITLWFNWRRPKTLDI
jgi:preprotein translocase subunit SecD